MHNCLGDFYVNRFDDHNNVERSQQSIGQLFHGRHKVVPFHIDLVEIMQTALHHVGTIVRARFDRIATAHTAILHFHQSCRTIGIRLSVHQVAGHIGSGGQRLFVGARRHERSLNLHGQFVGNVAERFQVLHVLADAVNVSVCDEGKRTKLVTF